MTSHGDGGYASYPDFIITRYIFVLRNHIVPYKYVLLLYANLRKAFNGG